MRELSLFSGAGGGLLGTKLLGFKHVGYVEWNEYCQRVIAARIADGYLDRAPIFTDVREFVQSGAAEQYRGVAEVVSAGFPCQPFSVAGKQQAGDDERNMWPATRDIIRLVRPKVAWLENVTGLLGTRYCGVIFGELASLGYDGRWGVFSASNIGAPHRRERIFIAAHDRSQRVSRDFSSPLQRFDGLPWGKDGGRDQDWSKRSGISEPIIRRMGDGVPNGVERLRACGNGQVPGVVARAWSLLA